MPKKAAKKAPAKSKKTTPPKKSASLRKTSSPSNKVKVKKSKTVKRKTAKLITGKRLKSKTPAKDNSAKRFSGKSFPIVAIGASAGGLEALEEFFAHMPPNNGMAFVIITHQNPDHVSLLPELLRKCTDMEVLQATHHLKVMPNCVYLSPPGKNLGLYQGAFQILDFKETSGLSLPIDSFFRSLAQDKMNKAMIF